MVADQTWQKQIDIRGLCFCQIWWSTNQRSRKDTFFHKQHGPGKPPNVCIMVKRLNWEFLMEIASAIFHCWRKGVSNNVGFPSLAWDD